MTLFEYKDLPSNISKQIKQHQNQPFEEKMLGGRSKDNKSFLIIMRITSSENLLAVIGNNKTVTTFVDFKKLSYAFLDNFNYIKNEEQILIKDQLSILKKRMLGFDWSFSMSDDHNVWTRGRDNKIKLNAFYLKCLNINEEKAKEINKMVQEKFNYLPCGAGF